MSINWGLHFTATPDTSRVLSGRTLFKAEVDEALLRRELDSMGLSGPILGIINDRYIRRVGQDTWLQVGTSGEKDSNFPILWDSTSVENGDYEMLEQTYVVVKEGATQTAIARQNIVRVAVQN